MNFEKKIKELENVIEIKQKFIERILEEKKEMSKKITQLIDYQKSLKKPSMLKAELRRVKNIKKTIEDMTE